MKKLKFKGFKADWILNGTKTSTMRLFDDKDLQQGDKLKLVNSDTEKIFALAIVTEIIHKPLKEVDDIDLEGHERWNSQNEMMESLKQYYGDRATPGTPVKIIRFSLNKQF